MSEGIIVNYWLKNSYKLQDKLVKFNTLSGYLGGHYSQLFA